MNPVTDFRLSRRNLPHWQEAGRVYFVTWRAINGVELAPPERDVVLAAVRFWDGRRWLVYSAVVMPDHVHVLARPLPPDATVPTTVYDLGSILHSVKGYSAQHVNRLLRRSGPLWQEERYDRIVRDGREFDEKREYVRNNPVCAGLVMTPEQYVWLYESPVSE